VVTGTAGPADVTGDLGGTSLRMFLTLTVPLWLARVRCCSPTELAAMAEESARALAAADSVLPHDGGPGEAATAVSHLARSIAIAAIAPDGITFDRMHWCTARHPGCPGGGQRSPS